MFRSIEDGDVSIISDISISQLPAKYPYQIDIAKYSLFQKKCTFNSKFLSGPPGGGGPKIDMVNFAYRTFGITQGSSGKIDEF